MTEFIVVSRPGFGYEIPVGARIHRLETLHLRASSTAVRDKLARGEECDELPSPVREYIKSKGLYGSHVSES